MITQVNMMYVENNNVEPIFLTLMDEVYNGSYEQVNRLLQGHPTFINLIVTPANQSLLSSVLAKKPTNFAMLDLLARYGVSFNYPINAEGHLPIDRACKTRDLLLLTYLVKHGAAIPEKSVHKLLSKAKDVNMLSLSNIIRLYDMIDVLGGIDKVAEMKDDYGHTFKTKAERVQLVNPSHGVLRCNLWKLLDLVKTMHEQNIEEEKDVIRKALLDEIASIVNRYHKKEDLDHSLGSSLRNLYYTSGTPIAPLDSSSESNDPVLNLTN